MKNILKLLFAFAAIMFAACSGSVKYENDLFSIEFPKGWEVDDSDWDGLDAMTNEVDFRNPDDTTVWFHFVKTFLPRPWKNVGEATELAKFATALRSNDTELIEEIEDEEISDYPTNILVIANHLGNDTLIQKQYVTYLEDSHIVIYFNANFYSQNREKAEEMVDDIFKTIKLKKVANPLEDEAVFRKAFEEGQKKRPADPKVMNDLEELMAED